MVHWWLSRGPRHLRQDSGNAAVDLRAVIGLGSKRIGAEPWVEDEDGRSAWSHLLIKDSKGLRHG